MFGWFKKSRFPKVKLGAVMGRYMILAYPNQKAIKLTWEHGDEQLERFIVSFTEHQLDYFVGMDAIMRDIRESVRSFLDEPSASTWPITDEVEQELAVELAGDWHPRGIGSTSNVLGGPPKELVTAPIIRSLLAKVAAEGGSIPVRVEKALRLVLDWNEELGAAQGWMKANRAEEAWRLAGEES